MSRSVKSFYTCHPTPAVTCRLIWRVVIVLSITQLVASHLTPGNQPDDNRISDDYETSSSFKFKNPNFEITYDVFNAIDEGPKNFKPLSKSGKDSIDDMIKRVFSGPDEFAARTTHNPDKQQLGPRMGSEDLIIPSECNDKLICDVTPASYPTNEINTAVRNAKVFQPLSHEDIIPDKTHDNGANGLCGSETVTIFRPMLARKDFKEKWMYVANTNEFEQKIAVSTCKNVGAPCINHFKSVMSLKTAVCQQHYNYRSLVVINRANEKPFVSAFRIPSGCCCYEKSLSFDLI